MVSPWNLLKCPSGHLTNPNFMHKLAKTKISIKLDLNPINSYKIQSYKLANKKDS